MKSISISALLLCAGATAAAAQEDALLPTHLQDGGEVFATGTLRGIGNQGDATLLGVGGRFKETSFQFQLDAGVGLGYGFEIDASIEEQFRDDNKAKFDDFTEIETKHKGFSDLQIDLRYGIFEDSATLPQWIVGALIVAPVGNDKKGQPKFWPQGVPTGPSTPTEAGIGEGVWHYGLETGISKYLGFVEPYFLTSYVFGGKRRENGVNEDRADTLNLLFGAQWHASPVTTFDTRVQVLHDGIDKQEAGGLQVKEAAHFTYTPSASIYLHVGGGVTLVAGGGVSIPEDHRVNDVVQLDLQNDHEWFFQMGVHILLGAP